MDSLPIWYRIAFQGTKPRVFHFQEIGDDSGSGNKNLSKFLAPMDDDGNTDVKSIRTITLDTEGRPNGFFTTIKEAREHAIEQLSSQLGPINEAIEALKTAELNPESPIV